MAGARRREEMTRASGHRTDGAHDRSHAAASPSPYVCPMHPEVRLVVRGTVPSAA